MMDTIKVTTGKRYLKDGRWHDGNGPLPDEPRDWEPPMIDEEIITAAKSDPDARPLDETELAKPIPMPQVKLLRRQLGLTQHQFADRFQIPIGSLRDWEQERVAPDRTARAYLAVIAASPRTVEKALRSFKSVPQGSVPNSVGRARRTGAGRK